MPVPIPTRLVLLASLALAGLAPAQQPRPDEALRERIDTLTVENRTLRVELERLVNEVQQLRDQVAAHADRARHANDRAASVAEFLAELLRQPATPPPAQAGVTEVLQQAARRIQGADLEPEARARLRATLAETLLQKGGEGDYERAVDLLRTAADQPGGAALGAEQARALRHLGRAALEQGRLEEARELLDRAAAAVGEARTEPDARLQTLLLEGRLARQLGDLERAEVLLREAEQGLTEGLGAEHEATRESLRELGRVLADRGEFTEAQRVLELAMARHHAAGGDQLAELDYLRALGGVSQQRGDLVRASALARRAYDTARAQLGESHPTALDAGDGLATVLRDAGRLAEAESLLRRSMDARRTVQGAQHPAVQRAVRTLIDVLARQGRGAEVVELERRLRDAQNGSEENRVKRKRDV